MDDFRRMAELIVNSSKTVVLTGAGASTQSGLKDFRSPQGMWRTEDFRILASIDSMYNRTKEFYDFYTYRIKKVNEVKPNKVHEILNKWEKSKLVDRIITQNVDGLHQKAGSTNTIELHGTLSKVRCTSCHKEMDSKLFEDGIYNCSECQGMLRPGVVLFGEALPMANLELSLELSQNADLLIVIGSSLEVSPANMLPYYCKENGGKLVIINKEPTPMDNLADLIFRDYAGRVLENVDEFLNIGG